VIDWIKFEDQEPEVIDHYLVYTGSGDKHVEGHYWRGPESKKFWIFAGVTHWALCNFPREE
jgi:hypothetical protein